MGVVIASKVFSAGLNQLEKVYFTVFPSIKVKLLFHIAKLPLYSIILQLGRVFRIMISSQNENFGRAVVALLGPARSLLF